jgi:hypothetical protein
MEQEPETIELLEGIQKAIREAQRRPRILRRHDLNLQNTPNHMRNTPAYRMAYPEGEHQPTALEGRTADEGQAPGDS